MIDPITAAELADASAYAANIKAKCVRNGCGEKLPGTWEHFRVFGNWCASCSGEMARRAERSTGGRHRMFRGNQYTVRKLK
jgi:hypothetical protein